MWFYIFSGFYGMTALLRSKETKEDTYIKNGMSKLNAPANASADTVPEVPFAFPGEGSFEGIKAAKTLGTFFGGNAIQAESAKYQTNKTLNGLNTYVQNSSGITVTPIHVAKKGETIDDISNKYGVSNKGILDSNKWLQNKGIKPGDKVVIPKQFDLDELRKLDARMPSQGIIGDPAALFSGETFQTQSNPLQTKGVLNGQNIPKLSSSTPAFDAKVKQPTRTANTAAIATTLLCSVPTPMIRLNPIVEATGGKATSVAASYFNGASTSLTDAEAAIQNSNKVVSSNNSGSSSGGWNWFNFFSGWLPAGDNGGRYMPDTGSGGGGSSTSSLDVRAGVYNSATGEVTYY